MNDIKFDEPEEADIASINAEFLLFIEALLKLPIKKRIAVINAAWAFVK